MEKCNDCKHSKKSFSASMKCHECYNYKNYEPINDLDSNTLTPDFVN